MAALAEGLRASPPAHALRALLRSYAAILFSRSHAVGLLLLLATATAPRALCGGGLAVAWALASARLFGIDPASVRDGSYGASALLLGLGIGQTLGLAPGALVLLLLLVPLCVLFTAALRTLLGAAHLPALSIPFLLTFYLLLGVLPVSGLTYTWPATDAWTVPPAWLAALLRGIGALFFLPRCDAGAILLCALLVHSRIAALLAALATAAVFALRLVFPALAGSELLPILLLNAVFTAIALGGVWFVPSPASLLLALAGAVLSVLVALGAAEPFYRLGLPLLIWPFNAAVLLVILAARQRPWDRHPKSVDFYPGTPEDNLAYFRTRLARFGWLYPVRFRLPLRGTWICTQGEDGPLSHQGPYRHAFDFEVQDADGNLHAAQGTALRDYLCYRLPVLAAAAGTVVRAESTVPDNDCGRMNLQDSWGNHVILQHAPGIFSLVAHLQRGSVRVTAGQTVRAGEQLGLCGNSGRSSRPHVHFQLQRGGSAGDPTLPCRFSDVVTQDGAARVVTALRPEPGQSVRNLEPDEERAAFFLFPYRASWHVRVRAGDHESTTRIESDIDPAGQLFLRTSDAPARLLYTLSDGFFTSYDAPAKLPPALQILRAALSRVPLDASDTLRWRDPLPARPFRGTAGRILSDLIAPLRPDDAIEMEYRMHRSGAALVVEGASLAQHGGAPVLRTRAELAHGIGPLRASLTLRGRSFTLERVSDTPASLGPGTQNEERLTEAP